MQDTLSSRAALGLPTLGRVRSASKGMLHTSGDIVRAIMNFYRGFVFVCIAVKKIVSIKFCFSITRHHVTWPYKEVSQISLRG